MPIETIKRDSPSFKKGFRYWFGANGCEFMSRNNSNIIYIYEDGELVEEYKHIVSIEDEDDFSVALDWMVEVKKAEREKIFEHIDKKIEEAEYYIELYSNPSNADEREEFAYWDGKIQAFKQVKEAAGFGEVEYQTLVNKE
ncbi:hypothetical protein P4L24_24660 [Bacillus cereus]|uniref:hypothetical protein n=1 Tax=Bacillus thuringiensis TaxID=1428 RepID=UPI0026E30742|nr:hypothetical protein [Bacillus thuringiensis]MDO6628751.1 hypothetical protein [Bacillus thuringiensis]MDO6659328.1 hypothetical protein [Bacillus thuringiensis]MDO6698910.1 hypothetical protein [Bacillus thuringiensis]MEC0031038.1 hypothetical protein [Bacillus cereus]